MDPADESVRWSVIARAAAGDRGARSVFGHRYLPVVRGFLEARWRGTPLAGELDDAVQEVFVECLRNDGVLSRADPERGEVRGLLFGVTRKVAARFEERVRRQAENGAISVLDDIQAREPSLSRVFDRDWARTMMRLAGELMRTRAESGSPGALLRVEILRLRFAEGLPIRDIAAQWRVDPDAIHRAYGKAREEFRVCLRRIVAEHSVRSEADLDAEIERVLQILG